MNLYQMGGCTIALSGDDDPLRVRQIAKLRALNNGRLHNVKGYRVSDKKPVRVAISLSKIPKNRGRSTKSERVNTGVRIQLDPYS